MRRLSYFFFGLALGSSIAAAASGDLIYTHVDPVVQLDGAQATAVGTWAVSTGAWTGAVADLDLLCVERRASGVYAWGSGRKTVAPSALPLGVVVTGRVP